ncbi:hypothetical protein CLOP_g1335 [Closterium sp. NIES-67]|nr:hypothetical protein CLOP_g1335 [Closterium sp. NIES-67]
MRAPAAAAAGSEAGPVVAAAAGAAAASAAAAAAAAAVAAEGRPSPARLELLNLSHSAKPTLKLSETFFLIMSVIASSSPCMSSPNQQSV